MGSVGHNFGESILSLKQHITRQNQNWGKTNLQVLPLKKKFFFCVCVCVIVNLKLLIITFCICNFFLLHVSVTFFFGKIKTSIAYILNKLPLLASLFIYLFLIQPIGHVLVLLLLLVRHLVCTLSKSYFALFSPRP